MLIQTPSRLDEALTLLAAEPFITLDTEFLRDSTYYPQLCLVQAANARTCALIDPLAPLALEPLFSLLADRSRSKILHAARQDLEVLGLVAGQPPGGPLFDTQVAAALLGMPPQIGYGDLVARRLGVTLPKGHARTDWSRRPLGEEQLAYAADDVRYLVPLYADLRTALEAAGRLEWLVEEMRALENPQLYRVIPEEAWKRLKGLERLQPAQRAVAKLLAAWREHRAMKHDKPRGWILSDDVLRALADRLPASPEALAAIPGMPPAVPRKHAAELLALIEQGRELARDEPPSFHPPRPEPEQMARIKRVSTKVREIAERLGISPELLATRRDVEQLVLAGKPGVFATGWRSGVLGEVLSLAG